MKLGKGATHPSGKREPMIVELGHFALVLALAGRRLPDGGAGVGRARTRPRLMATAEPAALCQLGLLIVAFLSLINAYVSSDFSVANVVANSHSTKPLIYRISGVWGNHEGSMLLWVLILALFGAAVAAFGRNLPPTLRANVLAVQASIAVAFLLFILFTSNPFLRVDPPPADGHGLNPILQDPALAFHPPFLYTGYVGFSIAFSFAIAALIEGRARRRLGALGAAVDAARLDVPHDRHRHGLVVGLLRARLGRLVVLGSGRERVLHALARRHGAAAFGARHGEARRAEGVDDPARDPRLLAVADGHLPRALGRADLGARLRRRSAPRRVHPRDPVAVHRRRACALRLARARRCARAGSSRPSAAKARSSSTTSC